MLKTIKNDIDEARMTSSPTHQEEAAKDVNVILERGRALPACGAFRDIGFAYTIHEGSRRGRGLVIIVYLTKLYLCELDIIYHTIHRSQDLVVG